MALEVVALALLTAAMWGASSPITKLGLERGGTPFQAALSVVVVSVIVYWSAILVQGQHVLAHSGEALALFAITGLLGTAIARVITYTGVQRLGASINSAGINTRPVFSAIGAVLFLGEALTAQTAAGIVVVVAGLIAIALSQGGDIRGWDPIDLIFPLAGALAFAAGNVIRRFGFTSTGISPLGGVALNETVGLIGLLIYVGIVHRGQVREFLSAPRGAYLWFGASGVVSAIALFALFTALSIGRVVVVDPISSPTSLFAILFTFLTLREVERVTTRLVIGAVLVVAGVVLITAPQIIGI
ncbi:MAG: DMT family transporter [Salinigranum sp.]